VAGSCEHGNEPSGSVKYREILESLSDYELLKKDFLQGFIYESFIKLYF
jgi:hypothetical protein